MHPPPIETPEKPPDVTLEVEDDVHVFDLQLPDRVKQLLVAAKLETVAAVLDYQRVHGGMTTIRGIGKETADLIAAAIQPYVDEVRGGIDVSRANRALVRLTEPAVEPVSVELLKKHLQIDHDDEDDFLERQLIPAARRYVEDEARVCLIASSWRQSLSAFEPVIRLERPPVQRIVEVRYVDANGAEQVLSESDYRLDQDSRPATITPAMGTEWPATAAVSRAVQVTYVAGFGDPATAGPDTDTLSPTSGGYRDGDLVFLRNYGGRLPEGLHVQPYYVVNATATTIQLSSVYGGSPVEFSDAGSGVHVLGETPIVYRQAILLLAGHWHANREAFLTGAISRDHALSLDSLIHNAGRQVSYA